MTLLSWRTVESRDRFVLAASGADDPAGLRDTLAALWDRGAETWPDLEPSPASLAMAVRPRLEGDDPVATVRELDAGELWLAAACVEGHPVALRLLDESLLRRLEPALAHLRLDAPTMEDIRQTVREKLLVGDGKLVAYAGRGQLSALVRAVGLRTALDVVRRRAARPHEGASPDARTVDRLVDGSLGPELDAVKREVGDAFKRAFQAAVQSLDDKERGVLRLHVLERMSIDEIAALHDVHRATAARWLVATRKRIADRTRRQLRAALGVQRSDVRSLFRAVDSQLDLSLSRLLPED